MARTKKEEQIEMFDQKKLKNELSDFIKEEVKKQISNEIDKSNKRLIREKNKKIFFRNILIVILILIIGFLLYLLNSVDYFDKFFINEKETVEEKKDNKTIEDKGDIEEQKVKEPTLDELKKEYGYLLNNIYISEKSSYLKEYYSGDLTEELKNSIVLNLIDLDKLEVEEDYNIIEDKIINDEYKKIFNDLYISKSFNYNGINLKYINKLDSYITDRILAKSVTNIKREIIDIKVNDNIEITTIEGVVVDNKLYNVLSNEEVANYKGDSLNNYVDKLNKVTYIFDKNNKLISIK